MSILKEKFIYHLSWLIFILFAIKTVHVISGFTDVPPPPRRPERFTTREELKRYLQLVHEYYAIIGRPRFGRSSIQSKIDPSDMQASNFLDFNADKSAFYDELHDRFEE